MGTLGDLAPVLQASNHGQPIKVHSPWQCSVTKDVEDAWKVLSAVMIPRSEESSTRAVNHCVTVECISLCSTTSILHSSPATASSSLYLPYLAAKSPYHTLVVLSLCAAQVNLPSCLMDGRVSVHSLALQAPHHRVVYACWFFS